VLFSEKEAGCRVSTPAWQTQDQGTGRPLKILEQFFLRLKVANRGPTFAKNVNVCITEIACPHESISGWRCCQTAGASSILRPKATGSSILSRANVTGCGLVSKRNQNLAEILNAKSSVKH
jgi:hypothetical protein